VIRTRRRGVLVLVAALVLRVPLAAADDAPPATPPPAAAPPASEPPAQPPGTPHVRGWDDQRRTMRSYGSNLLYNFAGVVTRGNHMPLLVTASFTVPALAWDDEGIAYFNDHPHEQWGDIGAKLGGGIVVFGLTAGAFAAGRIARGGRFRATTYDLSQAVIVNGVYTQALKMIFKRERPDGSNNASFPSGHASNAFAAATVIARHYKKLAIPGYGVATYIAFSRMAANKHHFSDIVAGAGFGYGVGRVVVRRNSRAPDAPGTKDVNVSLMPDPGPSGDGSGLALSFVF
jgi:membrane-associated phospholipid phosphatase